MSEKEDPQEHDEEIELTEEYEESEDDPAPAPAPANPKPPENVAPTTATSAPAPAAAPAVTAAPKGTIDEIPFTLVIEAARLPLTLDKLMQLQKGNVLELPHSPESGVDIVVGGSCIARGELIKVGDRLAVRILDI